MLPTLVLSASLLRVNQASCDTSETVGAGHIHGIHLVADESQQLLLDIDNGIYEYCRVLSLQSGDLDFDEVSCTANVREMEAIPEYDVQVDVVSSSELLLNIDGNNASVSLDDDTFVDADAFAYFYSPSMSSVFVFTAANNSNESQIDLITVALSANGSNPLYTAQYDVEGTGPIEDILDGGLLRSFDDYNLFMVQAGDASDCEGNAWLRYSYVHGLYELLEAGDAPENATQMAFEAIGYGYMGVDSRISRAYGFDAHNVRYYEADGPALALFRTAEYEFGHGDLSSYWVLMWLLIALFLCCCCVCTACLIKRRRARSSGVNQFGMTSNEMVEV